MGLNIQFTISPSSLSTGAQSSSISSIMVWVGAFRRFRALPGTSRRFQATGGRRPCQVPLVSLVTSRLRGVEDLARLLGSKSLPGYLWVEVLARLLGSKSLPSYIGLKSWTGYWGLWLPPGYGGSKTLPGYLWVEVQIGSRECPWGAS